MKYVKGPLKAIKRKYFDCNKECFGGERSEAKTWAESEDMRLVSNDCHKCICTYVQGTCSRRKRSV